MPCILKNFSTLYLKAKPSFSFFFSPFLFIILKTKSFFVKTASPTKVNLKPFEKKLPYLNLLPLCLIGIFYTTSTFADTSPWEPNSNVPLIIDKDNFNIQINPLNGEVILIIEIQPQIYLSYESRRLQISPFGWGWSSNSEKMIQEKCRLTKDKLTLIQINCSGMTEVKNSISNGERQSKSIVWNFSYDDFGKLTWAQKSEKIETQGINKYKLSLRDKFILNLRSLKRPLEIIASLLHLPTDPTDETSQYQEIHLSSKTEKSASKSIINESQIKSSENSEYDDLETELDISSHFATNEKMPESSPIELTRDPILLSYNSTGAIEQIQASSCKNWFSYSLHQKLSHTTSQKIDFLKTANLKNRVIQQTEILQNCFFSPNLLQQKLSKSTEISKATKSVKKQSYLYELEIESF